MAGETKMYGERLRDQEASAFRTGRTLAEHGEQLGEIREQETTARGTIDSLANAIGALGERTITQRMDGIDQPLDGMERVLFALARAQGIDPGALA